MTKTRKIVPSLETALVHVVGILRRLTLRCGIFRMQQATWTKTLRCCALIRTT